MSNEYLEMCEDLSSLADEKTISANDVFKILKEYSSCISVFDMMKFTSQVIEENKYVPESYRDESQKSYIESFLFRVKDIPNDKNDYQKDIDRESFIEAIEILKYNYEGEDHNRESKTPLIFYMASIYATFVLEEPIHPIGTSFPGSLKLEGRNGKFYCPVKDANLETPNAVCKMCLAEQLDF